MTPIMTFDLEIENEPADEFVQSILLQTQIRIESVRRTYSAEARERLIDLFGRPSDWGRTLRDMLWANESTTVPSFTGATTVELTVPCSFDMNVAAAKYFYGIDDGEIPLVFLFTGSILYSAGGRIQIQRISWEKECRYRMPVERWKVLMDEHYPNSAWMYLDRDVFDQLYLYKCKHGLTSWDETVSRLLATVDEREVVA